MRKMIIRKLAAGLAATTMIAALTGCGDTATATATEAVETTQEAAAEVEETVTEAAAEVAEAAEDAMPDLEEEIAAVQKTLTYMGGLQTADDADKDIKLAIFRNTDGAIIYIYTEPDFFDYGMYTTEDATTADGRSYSKIADSSKTYGYLFNEDLVTGIIVDTQDNVYDAVGLDEDGSRALVSATLGG